MKPKHQSDEFDFEFAEHLVKQVFSVLNHDYFRAKLLHTERMSAKTSGKPRIFFSNHSGMSFPWDAIVFSTLLWEHNQFDKEKFLRPLVAPMLSANKWMSPYMIENFWKRGGGMDATMENFELMMQEGKDVLIYPEGVPGIGKGFDNKYKIQPFSTSFLRMACKYDAEMIPVYTVNAEYLHPYSYRNDRLNRFVQKLGIPFLPLSPITALVPIFPWIFYFSFPAKIHYVFGEPIQAKTLSGGKGHDTLKRSDFMNMRGDVHNEYQKQMHLNVEKFGQDPYHFNEFTERLFNNPEKIPFILPSGWPVLVTGIVNSFDRGDRKKLNYTFQEYTELALNYLDGFSFSLPFSWPIVMSLKGITMDVSEKFIDFIREEIGA